MRWLPVLFATILGACAHPGVVTTRGEADAILVLGHRPPLRAGVIENELRARVEHGAALYREGRAPLLVMSGGESTPGVIEADVMAT
ncbi:MAG TPA: ElyC/SanA/YdcF family protein, partial [Polyangiales bacterium]